MWQQHTYRSTAGAHCYKSHYAEITPELLLFYVVSASAWEVQACVIVSSEICYPCIVWCSQRWSVMLDKHVCFQDSLMQCFRFPLYAPSVYCTYKTTCTQTATLSIFCMSPIFGIPAQQAILCSWILYWVVRLSPPWQSNTALFECISWVSFFVVNCFVVLHVVLGDLVEAVRQVREVLGGSVDEATIRLVLRQYDGDVARATDRILSDQGEMETEWRE